MANNKDKVSIANYLAVFGLAAIGVIIFFGSMFNSTDGKPTVSIIVAVVAVILLAGTLLGAIKAKSAENDPGKWKYVEWLCIVAYIVVAVLFMGPFVRFFYVSGEKETLQEKAREELNYITQLHREYDEQRMEAISQANQMLIEFNNSGKNSYDTYLWKIARDPEWAETATEVTAISVDSRVTDLEQRVNQWDLFDIARLANDMNGIGEEAYTRMKKKIEQYGEDNNLIPLIKGSAGGGQFSKVGLVKFDLTEPPQSAFTKAVRSADGFSVLGIVIYIILNIIVLLNVWVTRRSNYVAPGVGSATIGGRPL